MTASSLVLYGDARAEVIDALRPALAVPVHAVKPGDASPVVVVTSAGVVGGVRDVTQNVTVRVQVWHATAVDAHDTAQLAAATLVGFAGHGQLQRCDPLTGPFDTADPDSGQPLSWFTVRAVMAGRSTA